MSMRSFLNSNTYRQLSQNLFGWGMSTAIIGALLTYFQIPAGSYILTFGGIILAIVYFFSGFITPHVEPDWSLVYPELCGMYTEKTEAKFKNESTTIAELKNEIEDLKNEIRKLENSTK